MSQKQATPLTNLIEEIKAQTAFGTPVKIISIIATQIERANEAKRRIEEEGLIVRDIKGSVLPHPAIKVEADAQKLICSLLEKHGC